MMMNKKVLFAAGLVLLTMLAAVSFWRPALPTSNFRTAESGTATFTILAVTRTSGRGEAEGVDYVSREERKRVFRIEYPLRVRRDQTSMVAVIFDAHVEVAKLELPSEKVVHRWRQEGHLRLPEDSQLRLASSGFDIAPGEASVKPAGTLLPATYAWTITPKTEGRHVLLLDFTDFVMPPSAGEIRDISLRFGDQHNPDAKREAVLEGDHLPLEVEVQTVWGIGKKTFDLVRSTMALLAFVLMYPAVSEKVKRSI